MDITFTREELIKAIEQIDNDPSLKSGRHSSTYDLIHKGKGYPPILVLSLANKAKINQDLTLSDFNNNIDTPFKILRENGFDIRLKENQMKPNILEFIKVANEQETGKGTKKSATQYNRNNRGSLNNLKIEISFGVGRASSIPWIAFTGFNQSVKHGIYPVFLYYKEFGKLILAYGISETKTPKNNWSEANSKITINDYFRKELSLKSVKYGDSYVHKTYDVDSLPSEKILKRDLNNIIQEYKSKFSKNKVHKNSIKKLDQVDFSILSFYKSCKNSGLIFTDQLIKRFVASIWTKPFVICSGLSGSGKTKLAQAFAMWICQDKSQYEIVPVGADWTNREPLLGYPNALDEQSYVKPENGILQLILNAKANENLPYFLILDEMNLSHVERYFADFLSTMESKEAIPLHKIANEKSGTIPQKLTLPSNLFIIGTVNIDETTYMFSPKVLDRANTIEFRLSEDDLEKFMASDIPLDLGKLEHQGATMAEDFVRIAQSKTTSSLDKYKDDIVKFFGELQKSGAEFGYRTTSEIGQLISHLESLGEANDNLLDIAIMQKLLPKLHGSRTKLTKTLVTLGGFCLKDSKGIKDNYFTPYLDNSKDLSGDDNIIYKLSFEKICRMYKNAVENGFASYAEA